MPRDYVLRPYQGTVDFRISYDRELNEQQFKAVTAPPGPSLVIAGAGAGKTRTLVYRVAYLLEQGIPAERILLLTFTNKAAKEMMHRVGDLLGNDLSELWGGTFHSLGHRVLRRHAQLLGYSRGFTIMDREDARDLVKSCLDTADLDLTEKRFPKADVLVDLFSLSVNTGQSIGQTLARDFQQFSDLREQLEALHGAYQKRKLDASVMDFDDLLIRWLELMNHHQEIRELYQHRFQFVLVDEYQDTNHLQGDLIDLLAARHHNVMVVGDDSQSIYSWRGANFRNIMEFPKRYPNAQVYKIETNYRSTPEILSLANASIAENVEQFHKELAPTRQAGVKPVLVHCHDSMQQAEFVAQRCLELRDEGIDLNRMAVLYRAHFHALELQLHLTRRNIPFAITSGIRFFEQAHIKDVSAYLRLLLNPSDELAFKRLTRMMTGIGTKTTDRLWTEFRARAVPGRGELAKSLQGLEPVVPKKAKADWTQLVITMSQLEPKEGNQEIMKPAKLIELIREGVYEDYLKRQYTNYSLRLEDLHELITFARQFENLEDFLSQLALLTNLEAHEGHRPDADTELLKLSTIHQAKGLEFDVVFLIMLSEGLFPSSRSLNSPEALEEERRLFYVAVTRARNELYLSYPSIRAIRSQEMESWQQASRFISELPAEVTEAWNLH